MTSADHVFAPYANPRVMPGCVRCPLPREAHPGSVEPVIAAEGWARLVGAGDGDGG